MLKPKFHFGFTLLELVIAISIAVLVLALAVPSITGLQKAQKLRQTYEQFDGFVQNVRGKAITEREDLLTVWDDDGITVVSNKPGTPDTPEAASTPQHFSLAQGALKLQRTAALWKDPPAEWMFWHSGICEPVVVTYKGTEGAWRAQYDPLTGQGQLLAEDVP
jgi:prepilin-type N-terminal cleavage/methylation domain-containing protein